jgi:hypothetical protein
MSRAALGALGAAALLAGVIAYELREVGSDPVVRNAAAAAVARWHPAPQVPTPPAPDRSADWVRIALARPLFVHDRRPVAEPRTALAGDPATAGVPRLAGVVVTPAGSTAIFAPDGEGTKPKVVRVGDRLGAYEIRAILAGEVTLAGPEGERRMRPSFDSRPAAPRPVAVTAQPLQSSPLLPPGR